MDCRNLLKREICLILMALTGGVLLYCSDSSSSGECSESRDCPNGYVCQNNKCVQYTSIQACNGDEDCGDTMSCIGGFCQYPVAGCRTDNDCKTGYVCNKSKGICESDHIVDASLDIISEDSKDSSRWRYCDSDFMCDIPKPYCRNSICVGCKEIGCENNMVCNPETGICTRVRPGDGGAGEDITDVSPPDGGVEDIYVDAGRGCIDTGCPCDMFCNASTMVCEAGCRFDTDCCIGKCANGRCESASRCFSDSDCSSTPKTPYCERTSGVCVECKEDYQCPNSTCDKSTYKCRAVPPGTIGDNCDDSTFKCSSGQFCIKESLGMGFVGGYCSMDCTNYDNCPYDWDLDINSICVQVASNPAQRWCLRECYRDSDCRSEYVCYPLNSYEGVCWPRCNNPGRKCPSGYVCNPATGFCEGTQDVEEPCGGTYNYCKEGLICAGPSNGQAYCYKSCDYFVDAFCSDGSVCIRLNSDIDICDFGGDVPVGGDCSYEDCRKGLVCLGNSISGYKCYNACDRWDNDPKCPTGKICTLIYGESQLGYCK